MAASTLPVAADAAQWTRFGAVLVGGVLLAEALRWAVLRVERTRGDVRGAVVLGRLLRLAVLVLATIYALAQVGVRIGPLVAAAGVGGVALAFAVKSILENFLAGVLLLLRRPFRPGDEIASGTFEGVVEDVNLRTVVLRTFDGRRVFLPNGGVLGTAIVNQTAFPVRRSEIEVGVGYDADLARATTVAVRAVAGVDGVHADPAPEAFATAFGPSAMPLCVRFWHAASTPVAWRVRHDAVVAVKAALEAERVSLPFEQLTVRFAADSAALPVAVDEAGVA